MISFAQNAEDVMIARFFESEPAQSYVDVGAGHPIYHSVTKHFYGKGWRGLNLEIRPALFDLLCFDRPEDLNLRTCISDSCGERTFYEVRVESCQEADNGGLSTLDAELAANYQREGFSVQSYSVPVMTLTSVFEQQAIAEIGFLKIDVEGHEPQVLRGLDLQRWRPRLVIMECTKPLSREFVDSDAMQQLADHRYHLAHFDGLNQFFVRDEDANKLPELAAPVSVLDYYTPVRQVELETALAEKGRQLQAMQAEVERLREDTARLQLQNDQLRQRWETFQSRC